MFGRLMDRHPGWTFEDVADLNSFQVKAALEFIMDNPFPITIAIDPPKQRPGRRRR